MSAIGLWMRTTLRRHVVATVALGLVAGLTAGVIGGVLGAARRGASSIVRYHEANRVFDVSVSGCPPGVDPNSLGGTQEIIDRCTNPETSEHLRQLVATLPSVEATGVYATGVTGLLDPTSPNGWGRGVLVYYGLTPGTGLLNGRPIVVDGRLPDPDALDEVVLGELAAHAGHIRVGDVLHLSSWRQENLDRAIDGQLPPETTPFVSRVVGIVRFLEDVQGSTEGNLTGTILPDGLYAAAGWGNAHGHELPGYGASVAVRLRGGPAAGPAYEQELANGAEDWFVVPGTISDVDESALRRVVGLERQALLVAAAIAALAAAVLIGFLVLGQLRRELEEAPALAALGMARHDLTLGATARALTLAVPAAALAAIVTLLLSPLGPIGVARRIEFGHPFRADGLVLAGLVVVVLVLGILAGPLAVRRAFGAAASRQARPLGAGRPIHVGAVAEGALSLVRGSTARVASLAVCAAAVAGLMATGLVTSLDRVVAEPVRYGAWWTAAVGQYSDQGALDAAVERVKAEPGVIEAAGVYDLVDAASLDGHDLPLLAYERYVGHPSPVIATGRAPAKDFEIALGRGTARALHKGIGDTLTLVPLEDPGGTRTLTVVGIAVLDNPVTSTRNAGEGGFVTTDAAQAMTAAVPQSIAVRIDPAADRGAVLSRLSEDFAGSIRLAEPQADLRNLQRLRMVPWLIAALVVGLAFAAVTHALVTLLQRHRRDLAVLAAHGMTRPQLLGLGMTASVVLVGLGVVVGIPVGIVAARGTWRILSDRISIPARPASPLLPIVLVPLLALVAANLVTMAASRRLQRLSPSEVLRRE